MGSTTASTDDGVPASAGMGDVTTIPELRAGLRSFPDVLLDVDDRRVLDDALTSLDALERIDVVPAVIAIVGSSGSGKSSIVNAIIGSDVAETGVTRPTTERPLMVGGSGPVSLSVESEYLHVPSAPPGLVIIDAPPWEHDENAVRSVLAVADLVVIAITPSRYADASVARLIGAVPDDRRAATVLNRVAATGAERETLLTSVAERFGTGVMVVDEGTSVDAAVVSLLDDLSIDTMEYQRAAIFRAAAASGARHLAGAATATARDIGAIEHALDSVDAADFSAVTFTVFDSWSPTRSDLVASVARRIHDVDAEVVAGAGTTLAARIQAEMGRWDGEESLGTELDEWRAAVAGAFASRARIRWRRRTAIEQIERYAWRVAINADVLVPNRMRRAMGGRLDAVVAEARESLSTLLASTVDRRILRWSRRIEELAAYRPGELQSLANGFSHPGVADG
jgi:energy-coupling factor transporter ATP-binding protein EcfA2